MNIKRWIPKPPWRKGSQILRLWAPNYSFRLKCNFVLCSYARISVFIACFLKKFSLRDKIKLIKTELIKDLRPLPLWSKTQNQEILASSLLLECSLFLHYRTASKHFNSSFQLKFVLAIAYFVNILLLQPGLGLNLNWMHDFSVILNS